MPRPEPQSQGRPRGLRALAALLATVGALACSGGGGGPGALDDDVAHPGTLAFEAVDALVLEGAGSRSLVVVRSGGTDGEVSVTVSTADGAAVAPHDYGAVSEVVTFAAGDDVPKLVHVPIVDDTRAEGDEVLSATLSAPTGGAGLGPASSATITIRDDDARLVALSGPAYEAGESDGSVLVTVTRTGDPSGEVSVTVSTADGTATAGVDYGPLSTAVTFGDGDTGPRSVSVPVLADAVDEADETLTVSLLAPVGGAVGRGEATVTLRDDDGVPSPPAATVAGRLKQLSFSCPPVLGADTYQLFWDPDGASGSSALGPVLVPSSPDATVVLDIGVALHAVDWTNVRFRLRACNAFGCADSADVSGEPLRSALLAAVGYFKASNPGQLDGFGSAVALSGDGLTLVVGATGEDSGSAGVGGSQADESGAQSGAVYVFRRSAGFAGTWTQEAYLKASNAEANDYFGITVAVSDDGDTVAVGARHEDGGGTGVNADPADNSAQSAGAVYVFARAGSTWSQEAYVKPSDTAAFDWFGSSLALSGDGNTLAVGGDKKGVGGVAYVFTRSGTVWSQEAIVSAAGTGAGDHFGASLALSRTGDRLAVGAPDEDSGATGVGGDEADASALGSGAAYLFTRSAGVWSLAAYVKASNTDAGDGFGYSVALDGAGATLAVGAPGEDCALPGVDGNQDDDTAADAGAAYVFVESAGVWSQQAYVKASNPGAGDAFGTAVALNGPGRVLAVAAPLESGTATGVGGDGASDGASGAGAAYVYRAPAGTWAQVAYVKAPNTDPDDQLGGNPYNDASLAVALDGPGTTLAVGAHGENGGASGIGGDAADDSLADAGAVYLY